MLDFESSNAAALDNSTLKIDEAMKKSIKMETNYIDDLIQSMFQHELKVSASVSPWENLSFKLFDIFNIPLGTIEGALAAIKSK